MMTASTRKVWVLSDGKAGHYNQSKGVTLALSLWMDVHEVWIEAPLRAGWLRTPLKWMLNQSAQVHPAWLAWCYPALDLPRDPPDLVVAAGGRMMYAAAALAARYGVPAIFVGSLRGLSPELFHTVVVLEQYEHPRYLTVDTAPMPVSPQLLAHAAQAWQSEHPTQTGELWAMLIGGDGAGAHYSEQDWQQLAIMMNHLAQVHHIRWLVTTSRRTGAAAEEMLKHTLYPDAIADQVWWDTAPRKVMSAFLGRAQRVYCTIESLSMLTEAIVAQRRVIGLTPQRFEPDTAYQAAIDRLVQRRWLAVQSIEQSVEQPMSCDQISPMPNAALHGLAHVLQQRLQDVL
jgi:mitochondrial fission protein ELM1